MNDVSVHFEELLVENDFSTEYVVSLFTMGMDRLNKPLKNNFKELYYDLKKFTDCTELSVGTLMILVNILTRKSYEDEVSESTHDSIQKVKEGLKELSKLQNQIQKKINKFEERFNFLGFELDTNIDISKISKLSIHDFKTNLKRRNDFTEGLNKLLPNKRYSADYYSNLVQIKIKNLISMYDDAYWPLYLNVLNSIRRFYPDLLSNINATLTMDDKDSVRLRLMQFEKYHSEDKHLKLSKSFAKGVRLKSKK